MTPWRLYGSLAQRLDRWPSKGNGCYNVLGETPDAVNRVKQYQAINTTTWAVNDGLTLKNILSYAHLHNDTRTTVFGSNFQLAPLLGLPATTPPLSTASRPLVASSPVYLPIARESYVEELQASANCA